MPGVIYEFENQNFVTYEDNLKYMDNVHFVTYFDFKATTDFSSKFLFKDEEMYPISYCLSFAFNSKFRIDCLVEVFSTLSINKTILVI